MPHAAQIQPMFCAEDREDAAEAYVLGRLAPAEMAVFDQHTAHCSRCAELLGETFEFVEAFKVAARKKPAARPQGSVRLHIAGRANARIR